MTDSAPAPAGTVRLGRPDGRWVMTATVLGSSMAFLDATVVNIALPTIGKDLHTSLAGLQWTVTAYTLTLAGLILLGGSLGDRFGRRRIFTIGVAWFALASALCGLAPSIGVLVAARVLQGIGGRAADPGVAGDHPGHVRSAGPARGRRRLVWAGRRGRGGRAVARRLDRGPTPAGGGCSCSTCRWP